MNIKFAKPIILALLCFFTCAAGMHAQSNGNITVDLENGRLKSLFEIIEKQTSYVFSYRDDALDNNKTVSIDLKNVPVSKVLDKALEGTNLSYQIVSDKSIIITEKNDKANANNAKLNIKGTVIDETGEPIIAGTVIVKGTQQGVSTDFDGNYSLENVPAERLSSSHM